MKERTLFQDILSIVCILIGLLFCLLCIFRCNSAVRDFKANQLEEIKNEPNEKIIVVSLSHSDPLEAANSLNRFYKAVSARYLSSEAATLEGKSVFYEVTMRKREEYK